MSKKQASKAKALMIPETHPGECAAAQLRRCGGMGMKTKSRTTRRTTTTSAERQMEPKDVERPLARAARAANRRGWRPCHQWPTTAEVAYVVRALMAWAPQARERRRGRKTVQLT